MIHVDVTSNVPHTCTGIELDRDTSSENAVDTVRGVSDDVLSVNLPAEVNISRPDNGERVYGGMVVEFCPLVCTPNPVLLAEGQISVTRVTLRRRTRKPRRWRAREKRPETCRLVQERRRHFPGYLTRDGS